VADADRSDLADAWADYLGRWEWDWFCTLTFRGDAVHPEAADKRFRVWASKINRELYGPRWWKHGKGVWWVRAVEMQRRGVPHFHALLRGAGVDELRRLSWMDEWARLAGWARIEPPDDANAVRAYCAKYVAKGGEIDLGGPLRARPAGWVPGRWFGVPEPLGGAPRATQEPEAPRWREPAVASGASET
jgi:hypothetical protein